MHCDKIILKPKLDPYLSIAYMYRNIKKVSNKISFLDKTILMEFVNNLFLFPPQAAWCRG